MMSLNSSSRQQATWDDSVNTVTRPRITVSPRMHKEAASTPRRLCGTHFHRQFITRHYHWLSSACNYNLSCSLQHNDTVSQRLRDSLGCKVVCANINILTHIHTYKTRHAVPWVYSLRDHLNDDWPSNTWTYIHVTLPSVFTGSQMISTTNLPHQPTSLWTAARHQTCKCLSSPNTGLHSWCQCSDLWSAHHYSTQTPLIPDNNARMKSTASCSTLMTTPTMVQSVHGDATDN